MRSLVQPFAIQPPAAGPAWSRAALGVALPVLERALGVAVVAESDPAALTARVSDHARVAAALPALHQAGIEVGTFAFGQPSLDEVFLALTGRPAEPEETDEELERMPS